MVRCLPGRFDRTIAERHTWGAVHRYPPAMAKWQKELALTALWLLGVVLIFTTPAWFPFMESLAGSQWGSLILFYWWPVGGIVWAALTYSRAQRSTQPPPPTGAP